MTCFRSRSCNVALAAATVAVLHLATPVAMAGDPETSSFNPSTRDTSVVGTLGTIANAVVGALDRSQVAHAGQNETVTMEDLEQAEREAAAEERAAEPPEPGWMEKALDSVKDAVSTQVARDKGNTAIEANYKAAVNAADRNAAHQKGLVQKGYDGKTDQASTAARAAALAEIEASHAAAIAKAEQERAQETAALEQSLSK